jgi:predicted nucleic acid-binding protein
VRSEAFHDQAVFLLDHARENGRPILTTSYVMAELVALLTSPMRVPRREQVRIFGTLRSADWIRILHIDAAQDEAAWRLLTRHKGNAWSLVDCASFIVMREHSITVALTSDRHFEQAGFIRLLRKQ